LSQHFKMANKPITHELRIPKLYTGIWVYKRYLWRGSNFERSILVKKKTRGGGRTIKKRRKEDGVFRKPSSGGGVGETQSIGVERGTLYGGWWRGVR